MDNQIVGDVKNLVTKDLIFGNPIVDWVQAAIIFGVIFVVLSFLKVFFAAKFKKSRAENSERVTFKVILYSLFKTLNIIAIFFVALFPAVDRLNMPGYVDHVAKIIFIVMVFLQFVIWANHFVNLYSDQYVRQHLQKDPTSLTAVHIFTLIWKIAAFSVLILVMLDQLGFNITTLLAGLGVGGVAVAFALQNILSDVFASLAIIFDKPFKVGDSIRVDAFRGRVEKVGLKTTRIRSLEGEQLIFSNNELLKKMIQNYGDVQETRVKLVIRVTYQTPYEKLKSINDLLRTAIFSQKGTSVDTITCKDFAESSINYEVFYYFKVESGDTANIEDGVTKEILRVFNEAGISFAYPTRTVYKM